MLHKSALFIASLVAALALAIALAAAGFAPGSAPAATTASSTSVAASTADDVTLPPVQVDRVYVAASPPQRTVTVHKVVKSSGGDGEAEGSEGGD
jgi:hypothetical protein